MWEKVCTFIPCCRKLECFMYDLPYYRVKAEDDKIVIYRIAGGTHHEFDYCPFCGRKFERKGIAASKLTERGLA